MSVKNKGRLNFKTAEQYSIEAKKLAEQHGCTRFLIDHTETTLQENVYKLHAQKEELEQFGFENTDRIAIVILHDKDNTHLMESAEPYSHGSELRYFENPEDAVQWLTAGK